MEAFVDGGQWRHCTCGDGGDGASLHGGSHPQLGKLLHLNRVLGLPGLLTLQLVFDSSGAQLLSCRMSFPHYPRYKSLAIVAALVAIICILHLLQ